MQKPSLWSGCRVRLMTYENSATNGNHKPNVRPFCLKNKGAGEGYSLCSSGTGRRGLFVRLIFHAHESIALVLIDMHLNVSGAVFTCEMNGQAMTATARVP